MVGDIRNELVLVKEKDGSKNGSGILAKWTELRAGSKPSSSINFSFDPALSSVHLAKTPLPFSPTSVLSLDSNVD